MSHLIASLPPEQRAERYRQFAAQAVTMAQAESNPEQRAELLTVAAGWHSLAVEAERSLSGPGSRGCLSEDEPAE